MGSCRKDDKTTLRYTEDIYEELGFLQFAPILFASALTKQRIHRLADMLEIRLRTTISSCFYWYVESIATRCSNC